MTNDETKLNDESVYAGAGSASAAPSVVASSRTVCTEVLLGDTENLMEELKKRRAQKKQNIKNKLNEASSNNPNSSNQIENVSSSTSSSSTNLSNSARTWTIPALSSNNNNENNDQNEEDCLNENEPSNNATAIMSTRATVDFELEDSSTRLMMNKSGGGMSFDIPVVPAKTGNVCLSAAAIQRLSNSNTNNASAARSASIAKNKANASMNESLLIDESCSSLVNNDGSVCDTNRSSIATGMTLMQKYELQRQHRLQQQQQNLTGASINSDVASVVTSSVMASPKSGVSLGARIQTRARENNTADNHNEITSDTTTRRTSLQAQHAHIPSSPSNSSITQPHTSSHHTPASTATSYTNRTLFLRQQSAKAKRDSLERRSESTTRQAGNHLNNNQHKSVSSTNRVPLSSSGVLTSKNNIKPRSSSKASSRSSNSRTSSPSSSMSSSMIVQGNSNTTTSRNIKKGGAAAVSQQRQVNNPSSRLSTNSFSNEQLNDLDYLENEEHTNRHLPTAKEVSTN
jgi:hypothetical protein